MATEQPVNGTYAPNAQAYTGAEQQNYPAAAQQQPASQAPEIPKEEVGWYFVEKYYTTLSRSPEKLFLFYNKRSQFVSGVEEEKVSVCMGQRAISERIKELEFQDCKVRVTNVDSQASDENIVIQVIGEISNKQAPHRKFVQTFVLATQTNGYFVLNDIFRYIKEDVEEVEGEEVPEDTTAEQTPGYHEPVPTADAEALPEVPPHEAVVAEEDVVKVDEKLQEVIKSESQTPAPEAEAEAEAAAPAAQVNGTPVPETAEVAQAEEAPAAAVSAEKPAEKAAEAAAAEEAAAPEKPKDPAPTPAPAAAAPKAAAPPATSPAPAKPAAPKTWANLLASNRVTPAVPAPAAAATQAAPVQKPAQAQKPVAAATPAAAAPAPSPAAPAAAARDASPTDASGWQTAGAENKQRQSRVQPHAGANENQNTRAYIKNVYESVDGNTLKNHLAKYGEIVYFDISRQKNCAFVDFATQAGFQAAVNANPHQIGDDTIFVEERRPRPNQFQGQRGGAGNRGRGGFDRPAGPGRGGFKQDGRGGFGGRGRGGNAASRGGRGNAQAV